MEGPESVFIYRGCSTQAASCTCNTPQYQTIPLPRVFNMASVIVDAVQVSPHGTTDHASPQLLFSILVSLQIFDGPSIHYYPIGTFCGLNLPPPVRSLGSTVTVQFKSDAVLGGKGFLLEWTAIQNSGPPPTITPGEKQ